MSQDLSQLTPPSSWGTADARIAQALLAAAVAARDQAAAGRQDAGAVRRSLTAFHAAWLKLADEVKSAELGPATDSVAGWIRAVSAACALDPHEMLESVRLGLADLEPFSTGELTGRIAQELSLPVPAVADFIPLLVVVVRENLHGPDHACAIEGLGQFSVARLKPCPEIQLGAVPWIHLKPSPSLKDALNGGGPPALPHPDSRFIQALVGHGMPAEQALLRSAGLVKTIARLLGEPRRSLAIEGLGILVRKDLAPRAGLNPKSGRQVRIEGTRSMGFLPAPALRAGLDR